MKKAVWSSLEADFGEKALMMDMYKNAKQFYILATVMALVMVPIMIKYLLEGTASGRANAAMAYIVMLVSLSFMLGAIYYNAFPSGREFLVIYDDEIVLSTLELSEGPGLARISRREYEVEVIAMDADVYNIYADDIYAMIFNKPVRGTNYIKMHDEHYINWNQLQKIVKILKPKKVLLDGYYYPTIYAIFKLKYGEKYPELTEKLLKDFREEIHKYGHHKVSAIMNALRALCFADREKDAVKLAKAIVNGKVFKYVDLVDVESYKKWFIDIINLGKRGLGGKICDAIIKACGGIIISLIIIMLIPMILNIAVLTWGLLASSVAGVAQMIFHARLVFWSRVSVKRGPIGFFLIHLLGSAIMFLLSLPPIFISEYIRACAWIYLGTIVLIQILLAVNALVFSNYFLYRVGLRQAEILLNVLRSH